MRHLIGVGTPRGLQGRLVAAMAALLMLIRDVLELRTHPERLGRLASLRERRSPAVHWTAFDGVSEMAFTTSS
jgi:hypothetical protein